MCLWKKIQKWHFQNIRGQVYDNIHNSCHRCLFIDTVCKSTITFMDIIKHTRNQKMTRIASYLDVLTVEIKEIQIIKSFEANCRNYKNNKENVRVFLGAGLFVCSYHLRPLTWHILPSLGEPDQGLLTSEIEET